MIQIRVVAEEGKPETILSGRFGMTGSCVTTVAGKDRNNVIGKTDRRRILEIVDRHLDAYRFVVPMTHRDCRFAVCCGSDESVGIDRDDAGAYAKFQAALVLDPDHPQALLGVATIGLKIDKASEAFDAAESLLALDPQHGQALRIRYNASLKLADEAKIFEALMGLALVEPEAARDRLYKLGHAAFEANDMVRAKRGLAKVVEIDASHASAQYLLGLVFMREAAHAEAKQHMQRFLELAPNDPDAGTARQILEHLAGS